MVASERYARSATRWGVAVRRLWLASLVSLLVGCAAVSSLSPGANPLPPSALLATIPVGEAPTMLAMAPDGSRVYAASNGRLSIISTQTNSIVATIPIDPNPSGIAITPDGRRVLVTNLFSVRLTVLDTQSNTLADPIDLFSERFRGGFGRIGLSPDGRVAFVTNQANAVLAIVNSFHGSVECRMMDIRPTDVAITPDGRSAFVCGCKPVCTTGTIEVIDPATRDSRASIDVGPAPYRIAFSPDGTRVYTTNLDSATVSVVNVSGQTTTATVPVSPEPTGLAVTRDGAMIYVASLPTGNVTAIDAATNTVRSTVKVSDAAREVVVTPDGRCLYVSSAHSVVVVDRRAFTPGP